VYAKGDPADEKTHARFHEKFLADGASGGMTLKIPADSRVVWMSEDGEVTCIILDDAVKAERVARGVERELVMPENFARAAKSGGVAKAFVCVSKKGNKVLAALFAEKITAAFRTLEESDEKKATSGSTVTCGVAEEKATCGVRAIWTHASARKKGYARAMLNAMRANMVPGYIVPVKECAFTQPTEAGAALASRYCEAKTFLVY
jgi:N-acetyltransferase